MQRSNGIIVMDYIDCAEGIMQENIQENDGSGRFISVTLKPVITIQADDSDSEKEKLAMELHQKAHEMCFIANSCNFKIHHKPIIKRA